MNTSKALFVLAAASLSSLCVAESDHTGTIDDATGKIGTPSVASPLGADNLFQVQAANGDSNVSIKASSKRVTDTDGYHVFSLIAQAPTSKGGNSGTSLAGLDGLASGTTLALKFSQSTLEGIKDGPDKCATYETLFKSIPSNKSKDWQCDNAHVKTLVDNKEFPAGEKALTQHDYDEFRWGLLSPKAGVFSYGGTAKGGYQDFDFYDVGTLAAEKKREGLWSASGFVGYLFLEHAAALTGTLSIQSSYKDAKSASKCLAAQPDNGTFLTCANGPVGSPKRKTTEILALEWRQEVVDKVAFSLQASRDFRNKVTTVQLPVYFIHDAKSGLTGGLNFGWTSVDHKANLGVFVNQAFSLFN